MSRFFAARGSDSESDSSDEDLYGSSAEEESLGSSEDLDDDDDEDLDDDDDSSDDDSDAPKSKGASYFLKGASGGAQADSESDSEDDGKRVVKSAKDKLIDEIEALTKTIDNSKKINDWVSIQTDFDKVTKAAERARKLYAVTSKHFVKALAGLESYAAEVTKEKKKMNASNSRAFNTTKQRVKKVAKEYVSELDKFKADEAGYMLEDDDEADDDEEAAAPAAAAPVATAAGDDGFTTVGKNGKDAAFGPENIFKTLETIIETRGKKSTDKEEQLKTLQELLAIAVTDYQKISVLLMLIPAQFDVQPEMSSSSWLKAAQYIDQLIEILESSKYVVIENAPEIEDLEKGPAQANAAGYFELTGSIVALTERLDDELTKALQMIDPHTTEYVERLRNEKELNSLLLKTQIYVERVDGVKDSNVPLCRILLRRVEHLYFKPKEVIEISETEAWKTVNKGDSKITPRSMCPKDTISLLNSLCSILYQSSQPVFRTKAILCNIYHYALNDRYYKARDMLLMSHLQSTVPNTEPQIKILFNRTLVQIGLCAFRQGLISEAQQSLQEICSSSRLKDLLGQGVVAKFGGAVGAATTTAASGSERLRLLPFHMHINLELLECVYLTASLLIEVPFMAQYEGTIDAKKKVISKLFRRLLDYHEKQVFSGPPENTRDHIMQAAKALSNGEWRMASDLLLSIDIWRLMANVDEIKKMLALKIQEEGLRTYLFTFGKFYTTLSIQSVSDLFELPLGKVNSIVSKLVANEEISAVLDQKSNSIVFQYQKLTKVQLLALALADKSVQLAERNERLAAGGHQMNSDNYKSQTAGKRNDRTAKTVRAK